MKPHEERNAFDFGYIWLLYQQCFHTRTSTNTHGLLLMGGPQIKHVGIQQMNNGKAGRVDGLTTELMKADLETTVTVLCELFFMIWESEKISNEWRCGLIICLPKKRNLMECGNYRGKTLLPAATKVLVKVITIRIRNAVGTKLQQEWAGFRRGREKI